MAAPGNTGGRGLRDLEGIGKGHEKRLIGHGIFTVNALQQRILSKTTEDARLAEFKVLGIKRDCAKSTLAHLLKLRAQETGLEDLPPDVLDIIHGMLDDDGRAQLAFESCCKSIRQLVLRGDGRFGMSMHMCVSADAAFWGEWLSKPYNAARVRAMYMFFPLSNVWGDHVGGPAAFLLPTIQHLVLGGYGSDYDLSMVPLPHVLQFVGTCTTLKSLQLTVWSPAYAYHVGFPAWQLPALTRLLYWGVDPIVHGVEPMNFETFTALRSLEICSTRGAHILVGGLTVLTKLKLKCCKFNKLVGLSTLHSLTKLSLWECNAYEEPASIALDGLGQLRALQSLTLQGGDISSIEPLFQLTQLSALKFTSGRQLAPIRGLRGLSQLKRVQLYDGGSAGGLQATQLPPGLDMQKVYYKDMDEVYWKDGIWF